MMEVRGATTLPYGSSILPALSAADPIPCACQALMWFVSAGGLFLLPWAPMLEIVAGLDGSWDAAHHVGDVAQLMRASLGVTSAQAAIATWATGAAFGALLVCDVSSEALPATIRWPASWRCDNIQCYDEMFSEPTRASLVRRPGNVYSNALYLYAAVLIPQAVWAPADAAMRQPFWMADSIFAAMLLLLALLSTIWHASNAPKSQYIDLWAMDSCIVYLIVRMACLGALASLHAASLCADTAAAPGSFTIDCDAAAGAGCAALYALLILVIGRKQLADSRARFLEGGCPFAGRNRLLGRSPLGPIASYEAVLFCGMPLLFMALPTLVMSLVIGSAGSVLGQTIMLASLSIGWGSRMFERFVLDGCAPMNIVIALQRRAGLASSTAKQSAAPPASPPAAPPAVRPLRLAQRPLSLALTTAAALASPTAILHAFTGVTLLVGYMHARSLDQTVATALATA